MSKKFWQALYFYLVSPLFISLVHVAAIFSAKVRKALVPRYRIHRELEDWLNKLKPEDFGNIM